MNIFNIWNKKKQITHNSGKIPYFHPGQIWWAQIGKNIGSESLGKGNDFLRPVLVLQKFYGKSAIIIPLTSENRVGNYYSTFKDSRETKQTALLPQVRYIDGKRLKHQLSTINTSVLKELTEDLFLLIKNNPQPRKRGEGS